jgi:hypothetical protein
MLAAAGVTVYPVGFDGTAGGIDNNLLNHIACAGRTAPGFPAPCTEDGMGNFAATTPGGPPLYLVAENADGLREALETVAGAVCCGCVE